MTGHTPNPPALARWQEIEKLRAEVMSTECATCGHRFGVHRHPSLGAACHHFQFVKAGPGERANEFGNRMVYCKCKKFAERVGEGRGL